MSEFGLGNRRSTKDFEIEIIVGIPGPDGDVTPMVIGAGSWEDFNRAETEARRFAKSLGSTGVSAEKLHSEYVLRELAETGGVVPQYTFYARSKGI